ncbi:hypothetical protein B296_00050360 [Ensete ventricosum]|uniref:Dirigent protein n=1 Tax=Ensete ventricosum TaxID=4639 RepID=A0A426XQB5_ENSVE|nr:hypothetical protein B296_00050360 [Ensete ventricosum]
MASSPSFPLLLLLLLLLPFSLFVTVAIARSSHEHREMMTHLRFYFYDYYGGSNATTVKVVSPRGNNTFGSIGVGENILREGPLSSSKLIGKAQELTVQASLERPAYLSTLNFVFTAGKYNGSSFSIFGRVVLTEPIERGIVGGTGKFRMARGYTISRLIRSTGTTQMELVMDGPNATTVIVVSPPGNNSFESIGVGDNILREGPELSSKLIGRVQELTV